VLIAEGGVRLRPAWDIAPESVIVSKVPASRLESVNR